METEWIPVGPVWSQVGRRVRYVSIVKTDDILSNQFSELCACICIFVCFIVTFHGEGEDHMRTEHVCTVNLLYTDIRYSYNDKIRYMTI